MSESVCERCKCCDIEWQECESCGGEGGTGQSNCMDDLCNSGEVPCMHGDYSEYQCDVCDGKGGWRVCVGDCDTDGKHVARSRKEPA